MILLFFLAKRQNAMAESVGNRREQLFIKVYLGALVIFSQSVAIKRLLIMKDEMQTCYVII